MLTPLVPPCKVVAVSNGSTVKVVAVPMADALCPAQYHRKSGFDLSRPLSRDLRSRTRARNVEAIGDS
ncbi:hypothetical protein GCM10009687_42820 [Asanoa iriomotensis]|uniref:Transposase n=1 Tax=Asanoa iriomotensis TaxID=234613 RepID=A0ABQ4C1A9_9ACTN|nr:hypothetical protein Air01nite_26610 [Asanoa iriomotensis]